jgi:hypothetical protein
MHTPLPSAPLEDGSAPCRLDRLPALPLDGHGRWVFAAQIAQRLGPAAWALGGFSSAAVRVVGGGGTRRPAVAVVVGEPPCDGVVTRPPLLVVELAPCSAAAAWMERGVPRVWVVGAGAAWSLSFGAPPEWVHAPGELSVAGTGLRLAVPLPPTGGTTGR